MSDRRWLILITLFVACASGRAPSVEQQDEHTIRRIVALIDYVAGDYAGAVTDGGAVIDEGEYREQQAFLKEASERLEELPPGANAALDRVRAAVADATRLVDSRAAPAAVGDAARHARGLLIAAYGIDLGPSLAPSAERGRQLYAEQCATCHGATGGGDGPAAASLQPRPRSFRDPEVVATLSPVHAFSALTDGVPGTAMVAFAALPDADRWSLAFRVMAIRHDPSAAERGRKTIDAIPSLAALDYATLADLRDLDIEARLGGAGVPAPARSDGLAFLRAIAPFQPRGSLADLRHDLLDAKRAYAAGNSSSAKHLLTDAYLDGFEPLEARLQVNAPGLVRRIEDQFLALREGIDNGIPAPRFEAGVDTLLVQLEAVDARLRGETSPWSAGLAAFIVVVREGVESVMLVLLLLGLAKRAGEDSDRKAVHAGWATAIGAGVITWFASGAVMAVGGGNRELIEGIVALLAVVVLLYAGHFVLARMDAQRRIAALKRRFASISSRRRNLLLFSFAFIAAYREAFEVVLFLRAILLGAPGAGAQVAIGSVAGLVACAAPFVAMARLGRRVNAGPLLNAGGALLCVLAFVLAGKGTRSLQEAGLIGVSTFGGPRNDLLGVFPTYQTLAAQLIVIAVVVFVALIVPRGGERAATAPR